MSDQPGLRRSQPLLRSRSDAPEQPSSTKPPVPVPVPPELLAWAQQTFDEQEYREGVLEIETTGGRSLDVVIAEIEARMRAGRE